MNDSHSNAADLTAQALGESPRREVEDPSQRESLAAVTQIASQLRASAAPHCLGLHPAQRRAVMALARESEQRRQRRQGWVRPLWPTLGALAASVALGFFLGLVVDLAPTEMARKAPKVADPQGAGLPSRSADFPSNSTAQAQPPPAAPEVAEVLPMPTTPRSVPAAIEAKPSLQVQAAGSPPAKTPRLAAAAAGTASPVVAPVLPTHAARLRLEPEAVVVAAARRELDQAWLEPARIRPSAKIKGSGLDLASPLPLERDRSEKAAQRPVSRVYIHAWHAQSHACPWNAQHRLLRISMQLPPRQAAAFSAEKFPLEVQFDRRLVRNYRRLATRWVPAQSFDTAGQQSLWYEVEPVSQEALASGRALAEVRLIKGRFTTPAAGPFNESSLQVLDRGTSWESAGLDYLYEASVVGLGLLLQGEGEGGGLNHALLRELARRGQGSDSSGERQRFVRELDAISRAAGL
jgi:hypothetical protein